MSKASGWFSDWIFTSLTAELLEDFAGVFLIAQGRLEVAARVLSSALAYRDRIGAPVPGWC